MKGARACLVTGAGSGLGHATAIHLLEKGWFVGGLDLPNKSRAHIPETDHYLAIDANITDEDGVRAGLSALAKLAPIRGLVHCAGVAFAMPTINRHGAHPMNGFEWVIETNVLGAFQVARLTAAQMAEQEPAADGTRGCCILTASVAAFDGQRGQVAYAASKGAIASMILPMARDLGRYGIRATAIAPGVFETPMMSLLPEDKRDKLAEAVLTPKRMGNPSEFAYLAESILENPYLNGEVIRLDGGLRLG